MSTVFSKHLNSPNKKGVQNGHAFYQQIPEIFQAYLLTAETQVIVVPQTNGRFK